MALASRIAGLAAVLYGACLVQTTIDGVPVEIEEITEYPFDEVIAFIVRPQTPHRFSLHFRVPGWAHGSHLTLNGVRLEAESDHRGFVVIDRQWRMNDQLEVRFDAGIELRPYPAGEYAIFRGALQYVLPFEGEMHPIKRYTSTTLQDMQVVPKHLADAYSIPILEDILPDFGFTLVRERTPTANWHTSGLCLQRDDVSLIPMGCSLLRRAAFPCLQGG
jgi:hypothetical protein